jgi:cyclohexa-1,5-dienecarbonyl-CoA hydratase
MIPGEHYEYSRLAFSIGSGADAHVARITLRNGRQNIIDFAMMDDLRHALLEAERHRDVSVIVIRGEGDNFSAGVDIPSHTRDKLEMMLGRFHAVIHAMCASSKVLIAVVRGNCLGGGAELAMMCDIVHTALDARWGFPEIQLGCFPPIASAALAACVGQKRAAQLVLTGQTFTGDQAASWGLANDSGSADETYRYCEDTVAKLAQLSPSSLRIAKRSLQAWKTAHLDKALASTEEIYLSELADTADMNEGIQAWIEKRPPRWSGK